MHIAYSATMSEVLKASKAIPEAGLKKALELQKQTGKKLVHLLVDEGVVTEKELAQILSMGLGLPMINLGSCRVDRSVIDLIPKRIAERYELLPISHLKNTLAVAMSDPLDVFAIDDLKNITHCLIQPVIASPKDILAAIETYYNEGANLEELIENFDPDSIEVVMGGAVTPEGASPSSTDDAPVIRMVNLVLQEAIKNRASDIHFEPFENRLRIRYRVDGALRDAFSPPREMYNSILTRMKIVSDLNITERRLPQDGRFKAKFENREIDFRVSILPTYHGEKTVLRILDKTSLKTGLEYLGFQPDSIQQLAQAYRRPYGMVLVTGPTGSGKSTTLYSILNQLNTKDRNIMTIEDPIEYQVEGITQTQVNSDIGLNFSSGLRSLLRQSPDIILVGEIRDIETADIAVKSSLTGHLVFSTLHTNNASGAVTRLIDMAVEPFLLASSLIAVTAQRLLRRVCPNCVETCEVSQALLARLPPGIHWPAGVQMHRGRGCGQCRNTGYYGRVATMEVLAVDEEIQQMIVNRKSSDEIEACARKKGMRLLFEDALMSCINGRTTLEEVFRVTTAED